MYRYSKDGITILTVLDRRKAKNNSLYPIKVQVVYKRVQKYYSTGKELSLEEWEKLPDTKVRRLTEIRQDIENSFSIIKAAVETLAEKGNFSFDALNLRLGKATGLPNQICRNS